MWKAQFEQQLLAVPACCATREQGVCRPAAACPAQRTPHTPSHSAVQERQDRQGVQDVLPLRHAQRHGGGAQHQRPVCGGRLGGSWLRAVARVGSWVEGRLSCSCMPAAARSCCCCCRRCRRRIAAASPCPCLLPGCASAARLLLQPIPFRHILLCRRWWTRSARCTRSAPR